MRALSIPAALALATLVACADSPQEPSGSATTPAPLLAVGNQDQAPDRYIVVFRNDVVDPDAETDELIRTHGGQVHFRYHTALKGFAATLSAGALDGIRRNPNVDYVEADGIATVVADQNNPPSWGLDRVDQRNLPLDNHYGSSNDGAGVHAYIIDTGIRFDHIEYNGRASSGYDFIDNDPNAADCHGHGTHVAGTVGGTTVGIAKQASLVAVRVLSCSGSGSWSQVIAGVDWVTANAVHPAVANMSLGGGYSASINQAVTNSIASGVTYALAAGNDNGDACLHSPASTPTALTVGASTSSDARSSFSNWGSCVDLFAPGSSIYSSTMTGTATYASWSGTSMATPHVAGVAALYLAANPGSSPSQVGAALTGNATANVLTGVNGAPNLLLYNTFDGSQPPPPEEPPSTVEMHVGDVATYEEPSGRKNWKASLILRAHDQAEANLAGVTVSASWSGGTAGSGSCLTDATGICFITTGPISNRESSVTFHVDALSRSGDSYDPTANHDDPSDGSSFVNDEITAMNPNGGGGGTNPPPGKGNGKKP